MKRFLRIGEKLSAISICGNDVKQYSIVIHTDRNLTAPTDVPDYVIKAATVLQSYIYKLTDTYIPIYYDIYPLRTPKEILLGGTAREIDCYGKEKFADDEYAFKTVDGNLIINGGQRGVLYGVYTFIEKHFGVRYFTKDCERVLYKERIEVGEVEERVNPVFEYREVCDWTGWDPDFSVKSKVNGAFVRKLRSDDGYGVGFAGGFEGLVHTFKYFVPPEKYYNEHPEYFALMSNGNRNPNGLCMTNDGVFERAMEKAREWLDAEEDPTLISVSANDGEVCDVGVCCCSECRKIYDRGGNNADLYMYFVNRMARALKKEYPKVQVETLSYGECNEPPKIIMPEENVVIRVCAGGTRKYPMYEAIKRYEQTGDKMLEGNVYFAKRIEALEKVTKKIYTWDYPYSYYMLHTHNPCIPYMLGQAKYYADHNVKGVFINGEMEGCEFTELKFYLISKILFDPYMSEEELDRHTNEFMEGYYGAGWRYIKQYFKSIEENSVNYTTNSLPYEIIPPKKREDGHLDDTFYKNAHELFKKAYELADGDGEKRRVKKSWLHVDCCDLMTHMYDKFSYVSEEEKQALIKQNEDMYRQMILVGAPRMGQDHFMPVVTNFAQSPEEWIFWWFKGGIVTGDHNVTREAREAFLILDCNLPEGTKVDLEFEYKTNNENENGFLSYNVEDGKFKETGLNPRWKTDFVFDTIRIENAEVTRTSTFAKKNKEMANNVWFNKLPPHVNGVILKIDSLNPGTHVIVKNMKITKK